MTPPPEPPPHTAPTRQPAGRSPWLVLAFSVLGISLAAPLVRLSAAPALVIAAWRLGFSLVIVAIALLIGGEWRAWRSLSRRDFALACGAGVLLALHFWSWNVSISYTTVAASVSLVNTQPVIIALISARWLGERATRAQWIGIIIAVCGALVVGLSDVPDAAHGALASRAILGDLLACVGAVTAAMYYLIGRRIRKTLALWPYVGLVYGAAFTVCVALALLTGEHLAPQPAREMALFAGIAIGPMLLGHTGMNWALGHLPAYVVNLTTLGEPIGATVLAALLPGIGEIPGPGTLVGGALVLGGILMTARRT